MIPTKFDRDAIKAYKEANKHESAFVVFASIMLEDHPHYSRSQLEQLYRYMKRVNSAEKV